jgi:hypothetical protein
VKFNGLWKNPSSSFTSRLLSPGSTIIQEFSHFLLPKKKNGESDEKQLR